jgi:Na+/H+ antiporter NhaD/arsenite permease-like protein
LSIAAAVPSLSGPPAAPHLAGVQELFPVWSLLPFACLVIGIAALPLVLPHLWERAWAQAAFAAGCAVPIVVYCLSAGRQEPLLEALRAYASFVLTIAALYVVASGVFVAGDIEATPRNNVAFIAVGSLLASLVGTTGASILMLRPLLRTNRQRNQRDHLVPFFILSVSNAGGLLTPLGDPPLLLGYLQGVPFFWTLSLWPYWVWYVGGICAAAYWVERKAYARETERAKAQDRAQREPLSLRGTYNLCALGLVVAAVGLPSGLRELSMLALAVGSYVSTPRALHRDNDFSFAPIREVAVLFAGLFACLVPIEVNLAAAAPDLPLREPWQLFWSAGMLSAVLDNAPTYAAFTALARGLSHAQPELVAGITPLLLTAVSVGSVVMGATTYIGNGPNLMVRAIAARSGYAMPSFFRYAAFALLVLLPLHFGTTLLLLR